MNIIVLDVWDVIYLGILTKPLNKEKRKKIKYETGNN
jgi:hypothetical protein